jgi:DNA-binding SARP family transcriptional activator
MPGPESPLTLHLHSQPRICTASGHSVALERRAAMLLALAAHEPGIARARAAQLLWPDSDDPRRNLRQQMLRFRQQFGRALVAGEAHLQLAPGVVLAGDSGELLADLPDSDGDFGTWLVVRRAALAAQRLGASQRALDAAETAGDLDHALSLAEAAVHADAGSESAWHALMRVHYLRGEPAPGLAAYDRLVRILATQAGRAPSVATDELARSLRRSLAPAAGARPAGRAAAPLPVTLRRPPRLAGRGTALAAARCAWADGQAVLLEAEAGMGKSRLIHELLTDAGVAVLAGAGRPGDAGAPFATLARWLAPLLADGADGPLPAPQRQALALLSPGAAAVPPLQRLPLQRGVLEAAVQGLLQQQGIGCAVLDDLHFADAATLELVAALLAAAEPGRRWLLAMRPAEAPPAACALRDDLAEQQRLSVLPLAPLDAPAVAELIDALALPGLVGRVLAPALVQHTGGNPLYLLETLKQGLQDGSLARAELPRPASVGALIDRRLQRLSAPAITLARVAAVAGVDFSIELAEAATGQRAVELASAWQELQDAQVLRDESFAHDLVADAALRSVPPVVARRLHAQCAQWLAAQGVEPVRVAWHWRRGGRPAEAAAAFMAAALRAEQAARLHEQAALYSHAAAAFADAGQDEDRFMALVHRVRALNQIDFDSPALQEAQALVDTAASDSQRMRAQSELCGLYAERSEPEAAIATGRRAMALAQQLASPPWQVRTACHMATALTRLGRGDEAVELLAPLRAWIDGQPDDALRMLWQGDWGSALGSVGRVREAVAAFELALAAARRLGLRDAEGRLLLNCAVVLRQGGQFDRALAMSRQGRALSAPDTEDPGALPIDRLVLARDEAEAGLYATALPALEAVLAEFERRSLGFWAQAARMVLARLWLDLGQYARATPLLRDDADDLPAWLRADRRLLRLELARALEQPAPPVLLAQALELAGRDATRATVLRVRALRHLPAAQVLAEAPTLAQALRATERQGGLLGLQVHLARAALAAGLLQEAAAAAQSILSLFDQGCAPDAMHRAEAWCTAHQVLAATGQPEGARRALRAGERWLRQVALPQVPPPFIDSFLRRNPVNRALLAAIQAAAAAPGRG